MFGKDTCPNYLNETCQCVFIKPIGDELLQLQECNASTLILCHMDETEYTTDKVSTTAVVNEVTRTTQTPERTHTPEVSTTLANDVTCWTVGDVYLYFWLPLLLVALLIGLAVYLTSRWKRRRKHRHQNNVINQVAKNDIYNTETTPAAADDVAVEVYNDIYNMEPLPPSAAADVAVEVNNIIYNMEPTAAALRGVDERSTNATVVYSQINKLKEK